MTICWAAVEKNRRKTLNATAGAAMHSVKWRKWRKNRFHSDIFMSPKHKGRRKKSGYFTIKLTDWGGGQPPRPWSKANVKILIFFYWNLILWHLKPILSHCEGSRKCIFHALYTSTVSEISIHYESGLCYFRNIHPLWERLVLFQKYILLWEACAIHYEMSSSKRRNWGFQ